MGKTTDPIAHAAPDRDTGSAETPGRQIAGLQPPVTRHDRRGPRLELLLPCRSHTPGAVPRRQGKPDRLPESDPLHGKAAKPGCLERELEDE